MTYRVVQGSKHRVPVNKVKANGLMTQPQKLESITSCRLHGAKQSPTHADLSGEDRKPPSENENLLRICSHVLKPPYPSRENICHLACPSHRGEGERSFWSLHWQKENETGSLFRELHCFVFVPGSEAFLWHTPELGRWIMGGHHADTTAADSPPRLHPCLLTSWLWVSYPPICMVLPIAAQPSLCPQSQDWTNTLLGTMEAFVIFPFFECGPLSVWENPDYPCWWRLVITSENLFVPPLLAGWGWIRGCTAKNVITVNQTGPAWLCCRKHTSPCRTR